jgi:hypothetical protein
MHDSGLAVTYYSPVLSYDTLEGASTTYRLAYSMFMYPLLSLCQQKVKMSAKALFAVALLGLLALAAAEVRFASFAGTRWKWKAWEPCMQAS